MPAGWKGGNENGNGEGRIEGEGPIMFKMMIEVARKTYESR